MKKILDSQPVDDGFMMPIESDNHKRTWMIWPTRKDNWRDNALPAQKIFSEVANTIVKYEPVTMIVEPMQITNAKKFLSDTVELVEMKTDDAWMRDVGPTYLKNNFGDTRAVDWKFNAWGELYFPFDNDDKVAERTCASTSTDFYRTNFILEGGSIHVDGDGTLYTTEECLLNENRNPNLTKKQIENNLKTYLGVTKIIWLPLGVFNDETNGHVDNMLHVVAPGHVVLTWTDDETDPQFEISKRALEVLENETDARGRKIRVTKLEQPTPMFYSKEESDGIDDNDSQMNRREGNRLAGSYANFYICNGAVVVPTFNVVQDKKAIETISKLFPDRKVEAIYAREILLGGGNIHCITQNEM